MGKADQTRQSLVGRMRFYLNRLHEQLWVKPLMICLFSILAVFTAGLADNLGYPGGFPDISSDSLEKLLSIISSSMLVIAVFAVGSMLSAYASASSAATPRSFALVVADDVSQNALSTFLGAFIFGIIALIALTNGFYERAGRFALFLLTILVFAIVVLSFVRWVDRIARLGRLGHTIDKVEAAAAKALRTRAQFPTLGAAKADGPGRGLAVFADTVGYVQRVDLADLQLVAEQHDLTIIVDAAPGTFATASRPLAHVALGETAQGHPDLARINQAFVIGDDRTFDEDPRFGLVVLSEIASRALSPAVNDGGTAIDVIGTFVRLFTCWAAAYEPLDAASIQFDRVQMPEISLNDMFDDAFNAISRDGAPTLEVGIRLQKALRALSLVDRGRMKDVAVAHAKFALHHAEKGLSSPDEWKILRDVADWTEAAGLEAYASVGEGQEAR